MKTLFTSIAALLMLVSTSIAQQSMVLKSLSADTATSVIAAACVVDNFIVMNTSTNAVTINFYDSATTSTNYVQAAYTSYTTYATNYTTIWTNEASTLVTNTFVGMYTAPVANDASTNNRPNFSLIVPPSSTLNKDVKVQVTKGVTAQANGAVTVLMSYRRNY